MQQPSVGSVAGPPAHHRCGRGVLSLGAASGPRDTQGVGACEVKAGAPGGARAGRARRAIRAALGGRAGRRGRGSSGELGVPTDGRPGLGRPGVGFARPASLERGARPREAKRGAVVGATSLAGPPPAGHGGAARKQAMRRNRGCGSEPSSRDGGRGRGRRAAVRGDPNNRRNCRPAALLSRLGFLAEARSMPAGRLERRPQREAEAPQEQLGLEVPSCRTESLSAGVRDQHHPCAAVRLGPMRP
jgi:hypothetical protein